MVYHHIRKVCYSAQYLSFNVIKFKYHTLEALTVYLGHCIFDTVVHYIVDELKVGCVVSATR